MTCMEMTLNFEWFLYSLASTSWLITDYAFSPTLSIMATKENSANEGS